MYEYIKSKFSESFSTEAKYIFSAPGRTELSGNHTDHQHGRVLAASLSVDTLCVAAKREDYHVNLVSEGHRDTVLELEDLTPEEKRQARKECIEALEQLLEQGRLIQRERILRKEWEQTPAERECRERIQRIRESLEGEKATPEQRIQGERMKMIEREREEAEFLKWCEKKTRKPHPMKKNRKKQRQHRPRTHGRR